MNVITHSSLNNNDAAPQREVCNFLVNDSTSLSRNGDDRPDPDVTVLAQVTSATNY
jgi:hypothetical protein